jgi:DNA-binding response OmpR family regulator
MIGVSRNASRRDRGTHGGGPANRRRAVGRPPTVVAGTAGLGDRVISGDDVCRRISGRSAAGLMLTARGAEQDEVDGFALGADDYLAKPFSFPVLTARVRALARRNVDEATPVLERGGIRLIGPPSRPGGTGACWL